jgi:hypothetical protein
MLKSEFSQKKVIFSSISQPIVRILYLKIKVVMGYHIYLSSTAPYFKGILKYIMTIYWSATVSAIVLKKRFQNEKRDQQFGWRGG